MWKKVIIAGILTGMLFLEACTTQMEKTIVGGEAESEIITDVKEETKESEPEELTGELTILSWVPFNNWQYVIEDFTKEHPGVTITVDMPKKEELMTEEFMERYTTRIMTGDGFDIVEAELVNM